MAGRTLAPQTPLPRRRSMRSAALTALAVGLLLVAAAAAQVEGAAQGDAVSALPEFDGTLEGLYSG